MRSKDEKKILLAKVMTTINIDELYNIMEDLWAHETLEENEINLGEEELPVNRPIVVDNLLNTEVMEQVQDVIAAYSKLKLLKGLLNE